MNKLDELLFELYKSVRRELTFLVECIYPRFYRFSISGSFLFDNGRVWKARRRFGLSAMLTLGMGKRSMESRITEEATILCENIKTNLKVDFNPKALITSAVANVICGVSFGFR